MTRDELREGMRVRIVNIHEDDKNDKEITQHYGEVVTVESFHNEFDLIYVKENEMQWYFDELEPVDPIIKLVSVPDQELESILFGW